MSARDWYKYIGAISTGEREPLTGSLPPVKDTEQHQSASSTARRVFSNLLLQGNRRLGTLFAFHPNTIRDLCPIVAIQPNTVSCWAGAWVERYVEMSGLRRNVSNVQNKKEECHSCLVLLREDILRFTNRSCYPF